MVLAAFEYKIYNKTARFLNAGVKQVIEEEQIPITLETPPSLSQTVIEDDMIIEYEDDAAFAVEIRDYVAPAAQEEIVEEDEIPLAIVEEKPTFQGGDENTFTKWVLEHIVYPQVAKENGVAGRVVLSFVVDADGYVRNVKVLRGIDPLIDKEAVRVVSSSPRWKPGRQRDRNVRVPYNFPINFQLN